MKLKRKKKSSRYRGSQSAKRGRKARTRGSGNQGGKGWAGTGKRGDKKKRILRRGTVPAKLDSINIKQVIINLPSLIQQGKAKENKGSYEVDLDGYKVLGDGEIKEKLTVKASAFSASAREKIEEAGGKIILIGKSGEKSE